MTVASSGLSAFNLNFKEFLFQLMTFVIVLIVLGKWVFPRLSATLEARRQTLEESLLKAQKTEKALAAAEVKATQIIAQARAQADSSLTDANEQAKQIINRALQTADAQSQRLLSEAKERLGQEKLKLHEQLKDELADLVVATTEKVLREKLNQAEDSRLIEAAISELTHD